MYEFMGTGVRVNWNFNDIGKDMGADVYYGDNVPEQMYDEGSNSYFQTFFSKVGTSTNFSTFFPDQSKEIVYHIIQLRERVRDEVTRGVRPMTEYTRLLLACEPRMRDILFLRTMPGVGTLPHVDIRRKIALNIGFQNSNTATTYARSGTDLENFWDDYSKLKAYTLNDGDAYVMDVSQAHAVRSMLPEDSNVMRYIISYPLIK